MRSEPAIKIIIILVLVAVVIMSPAVLAGQREERRGGTVIVADRKAPIATSGENIYIAWWVNGTGNDEVHFRASTDGGATFGHKVSLSNSSDAESQDVEIAAGGDNVIVTWWERNQTTEEPVAKISTDNGANFGPLLKLATNGTIRGGEGE